MLALCFTVVLVAYCIISSSLSLFQSEASKLSGQLGDAPQLRSILEGTLRFTTSTIWIVFVLLVLALAISLVVLWLESLATR